MTRAYYDDAESEWDRIPAYDIKVGDHIMFDNPEKYSTYSFIRGDIKGVNAITRSGFPGRRKVGAVIVIKNDRYSGMVDSYKIKGNVWRRRS